jgi:hypothetical protein
VISWVSDARDTRERLSIPTTVHDVADSVAAKSTGAAALIAD